MSSTLTQISALAFGTNGVRKKTAPGNALLIPMGERVNKNIYKIMYESDPERFKKKFYINVRNTIEDASNETNDSSIKLYTGNNVAQTIKITKPYFRSFTVYHNSDTGTIATDVTVTMYLWDTDYATTIAGTALQTNTYTPVDETNEIFLERPVTVNSTYLIVFSTTAGDASNCYNLAADSAAGYSNGTAYANGVDQSVDLYFVSKIDPRYYALPSDWFDNSLKPEGCGITELNTTNRQINTNYNVHSEGSRYTSYVIVGNNIVINPDPSSNKQLVIDYIPKIDAITAVGDTMIVPDDYKWLAVYMLVVEDARQYTEDAGIVVNFQEMANEVENEMMERYQQNKKSITLGAFDRPERDNDNFARFIDWS